MATAGRRTVVTLGTAKPRESHSWKELRCPAGFIHDLAVADEARLSGIGMKLMKVRSTGCASAMRRA